MAALAGCAVPATPRSVTEEARQALQQLLPATLLLVGEQHDAPEHQALQAELVRQLAETGRLGALVLEMADAGQTTQGLSPAASESAVQARLRWQQNPQQWAWSAYGPSIMVAVRGGVPVLGGNLPASQVRSAMQDDSLDQRLGEPALRQQRDNIREGHCGLLPESQITPMTRVQIARDLTMARTLSNAAHPRRVAVLIAGNQHMRRDLGVPVHLSSGLETRVLMAVADGDAAAPNAADRIWRSPPRAPRDYCAEFKQQMKR
ncbi:ChaN family lipoprotein [Hydrogenophaga sp.]|uniref:ChaN family lipoprotein n=1 Tax=Hydrogenophaga sp. TaxID=1904254 RepID=UPI00261EBB3D|nr:ChaN family lipoprotein [Hydrogenophaga sp.]MDM7948905.1 ChaN family lipoprotein [Hydrogenophaga sp.]